MTDEGTSECMLTRSDRHGTLPAANRGWARGHNVRALRDAELHCLPVLHGLRSLDTCAPHDSNLRCALAHLRGSAAHHSMRAATSKLAKTLHAIKPEQALLHNVELTGPRRRGCLAARPMMNDHGCAARLPRRSGSG